MRATTTLAVVMVYIFLEAAANKVAGYPTGTYAVAGFILVGVIWAALRTNLQIGKERASEQK